MQHIFTEVKGRFVVFLTIVITVIIKVKGDDRCSFQNLIDCTKSLSVLTDSGIAMLNNKSDMVKICPNLKVAVKCIHGFTRHCMIKEDRLHFRKLFYGTGLMIHDLCRPGRYQDEYLKHAPCMINASIENESCFNTYTTAMDHLNSNTLEFEPFQSNMVSNLRRKRENSNDGIKNICCAFQEYVECSTSAVNAKCGSNSANFSLHFFNKMSSSMLNVHCTEYEKIGCGLIKLQSKSDALTKISILSIITWTIMIQLFFEKCFNIEF